MSKGGVFNKEEFANLLEKAKGNRSINSYANETGISAAHISRFLRQMIDAPPSPETISKLASKAHNEVSYRDLMAAAGHIIISNDDENEFDSNYREFIQRTGRVQRISPFERINQFEVFEKKCMQIILSFLYEASFKWSIRKPEGRVSSPDMVVDIEHDGYLRWLIEFKMGIGASIGMPPYHIYGQISTLELKETDKVTIAVNNEKFYQRFFKIPPKSLKANLYVMLIDIEQEKILKEEKLCSYHDD